MTALLRTVGGQSKWGTAKWADTSPLHPSGSQWAVEALVTDMEDLLASDPDVGDGYPVSVDCSGGLRFVVQVMDPDAGTDSLWGTAQWGTSQWSSSEGDWLDISDRLRGCSWDVGSGGDVEGRATTGTGRLTLDDQDGALSPWATTGAFVANSGQSWIRSGLLVRWGVIRTTALAGGLPALDTFSAFFTGVVESVQEYTESEVDAWVELTVTETPSQLATSGGSQQLYAGQHLSSAVVLALVGGSWPFQTSVRVPYEDVSLGATTLVGGSPSSRLDVLTDGLHWDWLSDGRGRIICVRRHQAAADAGVTFSNDPAGSEVPARLFTTYSTLERVVNDLEAARETGGPIDTQDSGSISQFGSIQQGYGFPRYDLLVETDDQVQALSYRVLGLRAWDDKGIESFQLDSNQDPVRLPAIMAHLAAVAREGYSYGVRYVHPSGTEVSETVVVEAQHHDILALGPEAAGIRWTCTITTGRSGELRGA